MARATEPLRDLPALLATLEPRLHPGTWIFAVLPEDHEAAELTDLDPLATFREEEGLTVIVEEARARVAGLDALFRASWITLAVHSDLEAVGLTAAVATALAEAGIPCNVLAAAHHDHLFVPVAEGERAMGVLRGLQEL